VGFEAKLWLAADKPCGNLDAAEYVHVVIGLTATPSKQTNGLFSQKPRQRLEQQRHSFADGCNRNVEGRLRS
jgi:hypothetical protein